MLSPLVVCDPRWPHGLQPIRVLCPCDFPGKSTGMSCHARLQGIFPTQGLNPCLLHCRWILYLLSHPGSLRIHRSPSFSISSLFWLIFIFTLFYFTILYWFCSFWKTQSHCSKVNHFESFLWGISSRFPLASHLALFAWFWVCTWYILISRSLPLCIQDGF